MNSKDLFNLAEETITSLEDHCDFVIGIIHRDTKIDCIGIIEDDEFLIYPKYNGDDIGYGENNPHKITKEADLGVYMNKEELFYDAMDWWYNKGGMQQWREEVRSNK